MVKMMSEVAANQINAAVENNAAFVVLSTLMFNDEIPYREAWTFIPEKEGIWNVSRCLYTDCYINDGNNWSKQIEEVQIEDVLEWDIFTPLDNAADEIAEAQALIGVKPAYLCTVYVNELDGPTEVEPLEELIEPQEPSKEELAKIFNA